jgi:hypothetical protein
MPEDAFDRSSLQARGVPERWEFVSMGAVLSVAAWVTARSGSGMWFSDDFWGLLLSRDGIAGLIEPHAGHLVFFHVAITQAVYAIAGLDAPWVFLGARIVVWSAVTFVLWYVARRRGATSWVALAYGASIAFFALSAWITGWLIGNPIAVMTTIGTAAIIERDAEPSMRKRFIVALLGIVLVSATSLGVVGMAALIITTAVVHSARRYFLPLLAGVGVYAFWYVIFAGSGGGSTLELSAIVDVPYNAIQIVIHGFSLYLGASFAWSALVVGLLLAALAASFIQRRPSSFDLVMLLWAGGFVILVTLTRIAAGQALIRAPRYEYVAILALLAVLAPRLRVPSDRWSWIVAASVVATVVAGVWVVDANLDYLERGISFWVNRTSDSRRYVEAAGWMVDRGEPFEPRASVDPGRGGMLRAEGLVELLGDGWDPAEPTDSAIETGSRGNIRMYIRFEDGSTGEVCVNLIPETAIVVTPGGLAIDVGPDVEATVGYRDVWGRGETLLLRDASIIPVVDLAAELTVSATGPAVVCQEGS